MQVIKHEDIRIKDIQFSDIDIIFNPKITDNLLYSCRGKARRGKEIKMFYFRLDDPDVIDKSLTWQAIYDDVDAAMSHEI